MMHDTSDAQIKSEMDKIIKNIDAILKKVEQMGAKPEKSLNATENTIE
jgi:hypothetical protein